MRRWWKEAWGCCWNKREQEKTHFVVHGSHIHSVEFCDDEQWCGVSG